MGNCRSQAVGDVTLDKAGDLIHPVLIGSVVVVWGRGKTGSGEEISPHRSDRNCFGGAASRSATVGVVLAVMVFPFVGNRSKQPRSMGGCSHGLT